MVRKSISRCELPSSDNRPIFREKSRNMKIVRSILAIVIGLISAMATIAMIDWINHAIFRPPLPEGFNPYDREAAKNVMDNMPLGALLMLPIAWVVGAFVGGGLAALIAGRGRCWHAGIIGALVLAATIANFVLIPHPNWIIVAGLLLPLPVSLLAGKLVSLCSPPPVSDP